MYVRTCTHAHMRAAKHACMHARTQVAKLGRQVLRIAGCELHFVDVCGASGGAGAGGGAGGGANGVASPHHGNTLGAWLGLGLRVESYGKGASGAAGGGADGVALLHTAARLVRT